MKKFRLTCRRMGRVLVMSALMVSLLITTVAGEALVLHQHGLRRTHLHLLGWGDLQSNAALSQRFGHVSKAGGLSPILAPTASQRVRIVAVVAIGSVFVSTAESDDTAQILQVSFQSGSNLTISPTEKLPAGQSLFTLLPERLDHSASADFLHRNHTLLI